MQCRRFRHCNAYVQFDRVRQKSFKDNRNFWNYYRDESIIGVGVKKKYVNYSIKDSKSFGYKTSITGKLEGISTEK